MITGNRTTYITYFVASRVTFTFDLRRKPLYYIVNLIIPCCLLSCIVAMTFILPPNCYVRLTLSTYILRVRSFYPECYFLQGVSIACYAQPLY